MTERLYAIDIEAYDPDLHTMGDASCRTPGSSDDDGSCILVAGVFDGDKYTPCYPGTESWSYLRDVLESESPKVLHNGIYDLAWLCCRYNLKTGGLLHDTMTRMTYIDEYAELGLDACCKYFRLPSKNNEATIEKWYEDHKAEIKAKGVKLVGGVWKDALYLWNEYPEFRTMMVTYNEQDCRITHRLYWTQEPRLRDVMAPYLVDTKLLPLIIRMKKKGILIDKEAMNKLAVQVTADKDRVENELIAKWGIDLTTIKSTKKLTTRLNELGIHSPMKTPSGAESFGADALARLMHYPMIPLIVEVKGYQKLLDTYINGSMANAVLSDGRIHCTFSPNKREDGGTVTGRFACSKPNLQQIPARDKAVGHNYGQAMRSLFLPEEGCMISALDYSQIEYLLLAHFAQGPQAEWFRQQANAGVDFHTVAMQATGIPSRQVVKTFNYGVIYGMGWQTAMLKNYVLFEKQAAEHGKDITTYTQEVYNNYHAKLPVIKYTMNIVQNTAKLQGYVKTIGGRYQHKPKPSYDPLTGKVNDYLYKMLNKLIQGSAADILKNALYTAYTSGVFDVLTMHITVHDENVVSVPYNKIGAEANAELKHIMDCSFKDQLLVPMKAACELGPNWGYWDHDIWDNMQKGIFDKQQDCWWSKNV